MLRQCVQLVILKEEHTTYCWLFLTLCTVPLTFRNVSVSFLTDSFLFKNACRMYKISLHELKLIDF